MTGSVKRAVDETDRRRKIQVAYNKKYGITPKTVIREIKDILPDAGDVLEIELGPIGRSRSELDKLLKKKVLEMRDAADALDFELASVLRDEIRTLEEKMNKKEKTVRLGRKAKAKVIKVNEEDDQKDER
jgi:excinuclease ABC subunit B